MVSAYKPTNDPKLDTFRTEYLFGAAFVLALLTPREYSFREIMWTFSIWLESVAILPQLFLLQRTGEAEVITTHYLFALGMYRLLYIPNWIWRYFTDTKRLEWVAVVAGIIQSVLYSDFFWVYYNSVLQGKKFKLPV
jgi:ER lumen protein retaining receptor